VIDAGLAVGGVEEHVAERLLGQRPVTKRRDLDVKLSTDPADFGLADAAVGTERLDQVVDFRVLVPCRYASMITANSD
jgi:hypothetical protein